ncbi:hypothetical protein ABZ891_33035 [Streptomyces sp. NPDC047023]|uniref:hypothetical protein n=1 Tax=Streptomyces sp. NPDC047023 TaxID=3155139 RepID=UPI0033F8C6BD
MISVPFMCFAQVDLAGPDGIKAKTVRVDQYDLARLLLMFRSLMREQKPGSWDGRSHTSRRGRASSASVPARVV